MLRQLRGKTDVIVLLSHLGLAKDVELAQSISGIDVIIGGHSGVHIGTPHRVNHTIILHTAANGMSGARVDLQPTRANASHALERMPPQLEFATYLTPLTEDIGSCAAIDKRLEIYRKKYPHRFSVDGP
jgi:hypothetical protein